MVALLKKIISYVPGDISPTLMIESLNRCVQLSLMAVWNTYFSLMTTRTGKMNNANADTATQMS